MKRNDIIKSTLLLMIAVALFSCKENPYIANPGDADTDATRPLITVELDDSTAMYPAKPADCITVKEALRIGHAMNPSEMDKTTKTSLKRYKIFGYVSELVNDKNADASNKNVVNSYGNFFFYMKDKPTDIESFYCYQVYAGPGQKKFTDLNEIPVGTWVVIDTYIYNYSSTIETPGTGDRGYMVSRSYDKVRPDFVGDGSLETPYTIVDIIEVNKFAKFGGPIQTKDQYVKGYIVGTAANTTNDIRGIDDMRLEPEFDNKAIDRKSILIADEQSTTLTADEVALYPLSVTAIAKVLSLYKEDHPENYHKEILMHGTISEERGVAALKDVDYIKVGDTVLYDNIEK